jgi:hypothetical protein
LPGNRGLRRCDLKRGSIDLLYRRAHAEEALEPVPDALVDLALQGRRLSSQLLPFESTLEREQESVDRLRQVVVGTRVHRAHG